MLKTLQHQLQKATKNPFLQQSLITLILRVFGVIILFGFTVFLTKSYPPKIVGQYDFVRSFLLVVGSICLLGCDQSILYFKGRIKNTDTLEGLKKVYKKMVVMLFFMSVLLFLIVLCLNKAFVNNYFSDPGVYSVFLKSSGIMMAYGLTILNTEVFRALDHFYNAELFRNIIKYIPVFVGSVVLSSFHLESYLADVFLVGFIFLAVITSGITLHYFSKVTVNNEVEFFSYKEIIGKSYPIAISGMAMFLLMSFDIMFLKKYRDDATVAFYSVAVKLMTLLSVVILTVNITVSAQIAEYFSNNNKKELNAILKNSARLIFLLTLPIVLVICFFSGYVLSFFGENYVVAKQALLILMVGQGICSAFGSAPVYMNMTGRQHNFQIILIFAVIINFVLNRFLIPEYGMTGAAIAYVSSSIFWNCISAAVIYRKDKVKVYLH